MNGGSAVVVSQTLPTPPALAPPRTWAEIENGASELLAKEIVSSIPEEILIGDSMNSLEAVVWFVYERSEVSEDADVDNSDRLRP